MFIPASGNITDGIKALCLTELRRLCLCHLEVREIVMFFMFTIVLLCFLTHEGTLKLFYMLVLLDVDMCDDDGEISCGTPSSQGRTHTLRLGLFWGRIKAYFLQEEF